MFFFFFHLYSLQKDRGNDLLSCKMLFKDMFQVEHMQGFNKRFPDSVIGSAKAYRNLFICYRPIEGADLFAEAVGHMLGFSPPRVSLLKGQFVKEDYAGCVRNRNSHAQFPPLKRSKAVRLPVECVCRCHTTFLLNCIVYVTASVLEMNLKLNLELVFVYQVSETESDGITFPK